MNEEEKGVPERLYWAFLSYRHADNREQDRQWALWLHTQLEQYEVPSDLIGKRNRYAAIIPERIFPVFRDEVELPADSSLRSGIQSALEKASALIVLCSPRAVESRYVAEEIEYFISLGKGNRIIPAILAGEPGDPLKECFPEPLRRLTSGNTTETHTQEQQPLAADFRLDSGEEGFTSPEAYRHRLERDPSLRRKQVEHAADSYGNKCQLAKLKIIAGVMGVGLDDLRRRDKLFRLEQEKRKSRVLRRWLAAVIALAFIAIGAGLYANRQRIESDRARSDAEDLIAFLQDDAKSTLSQIGRLDVMEKLNQAVFGYLDKNPDSTSGLRHRVESKAEYDQALLYLKTGRIDKATDYLKKAMANSKAAARLQERDNWLDVAAIASYRYAAILCDERQLDDAKKYLLDAGELAARVLAMDPQNADALTADYGQRYMLTEIKAAQGLHEEALTGLSELDAWFEKRRASRGNKAEVDHVLVVTRMSDLASAAGRNWEALEAAERALELSRDVNPGDQQDKAGVRARLQIASVHDLSGNYKKAAENLEGAMILVRKRLDIDPQSKEWTELAIEASRALAGVRAKDGQNEKALQQLNTLALYARRLHRLDNTSTAGIRALVNSLVEQADFVLGTSYPDPPAARAHARELLAEALDTLRFAQAANLPPGDANAWSEQIHGLEKLTEEIQNP